jgi:uncharacterized cupin superfamily protein
VGLATVNIRLVELDHRLDEAGFRHAATAVGDRLGARRIGAGVYRAEAGAPIWPYHYHHGIEEWLYVLAGAPVLRDPAGTRTLAPGDLVRFPSGHRGAHTVSGPGHFAIFATGQHDEPWLSVYPDSDKVSGPGGILLRSAAVGYWHGEGKAAPAAVEAEREPATTPPQPVLSVGTLPPGGSSQGCSRRRSSTSLRARARGRTATSGAGRSGSSSSPARRRCAIGTGGRSSGRATSSASRRGPPAPISCETTEGRSPACSPSRRRDSPSTSAARETGRWVLRHAPGEDDLELQA